MFAYPSITQWHVIQKKRTPTIKLYFYPTKEIKQYTKINSNEIVKNILEFLYFICTYIANWVFNTSKTHTEVNILYYLILKKKKKNKILKKKSINNVLLIHTYIIK